MAEQYQNEATVQSLDMSPGIKRDGTPFDGRFAQDGIWCRWRNGRPKKMGGYREIENGLDGPVRAVLAYGLNQIVRTFLFSSEGVQGIDLDYNCIGSVPVDGGPTGFVPDDLLTWQVDTLFDATGGGDTLIIAHASKYLSDIADQTDYPFYYGSIADFNTLGIPNASVEQVSGGIVVLHPYLFIYGNNGLIQNSAANDVTDFVGGDSNSVNVSGTKIVRGYPIRGGGNAPAGLFWSLQELIRVNFVGGTRKFTYDMISSKSSILSPNGIVEYDGVFYWAGIDRFLMYNGSVQEIPNQMNADFFFDNLNIAQRCKIWSTSVTRWGEIWWFFCKGSATEPNWAVVLNVREKTWYDTPITRSAGYFSQVLRFPLWADSETNTDVTPAAYRFWQHEFGTDKVTAEDQLAIDSYFDTCDLGFVNGDPIQGNASPGMNYWTRIVRIEPDFRQTGEMTVELFTKKFANSESQSQQTLSFTSDTETIEPRVQGRLNKLRFRSNVASGDYHMGKTLLIPEVGDPRAT